MESKSKKHPSLGRFGEPATLVLLSLASGPKHGYALMTSIEEEMGIKLGPGTLYGAIAKLMRLGMIKALESEDRAKPYCITSSGQKAVAEYIRLWAPIIKLGQARLA
jgi:DNA-binding PadR family transcriptional regulator